MSRDKHGQLVSGRGIPLIHQEVHDVPIVTVENYCKWYTFFIIRPNGEVEEPNIAVMNEAVELCSNKAPCPRVDHCFHPALLEAYAHLINGEFPEVSREIVTGRWVIDVDENRMHDFKEKYRG